MASVNSRVVGIKAEVLNDLASRFLINLSSEEKDPIKLCTYIELAHWYYLDLMRPEDPSLPACNLKEFMRALFKHCPWLLRDSTKQQDLNKLITEWKNHKFSKPVRGAIILDRDMSKCLLVQGYTAGTSWGFPKGKLEEGETNIDAAVREVYEETGFDIRALVNEKLYLEANIRDTNVRMYLIVGVAESTVFEPKTRNEIKNIQWFNIKDLPSYKKDVGSLQALGKSSNNFFMIIPFIGQLRRWIKGRRNKRKGISANLTSPERALSSSSSSQAKREQVSQSSPQPKIAQSQFQTQPRTQFQTQPQFQTSVLLSRSGPHQGTVVSVATPPLLATPTSHTTNPSYNMSSRPVPILPPPLVTPIAMYPPSRQWIQNNPFGPAVNPQRASTDQLAALVHSNPALYNRPHHQQQQYQMSPQAVLPPGTQQHRVLLPSPRAGHSMSRLPGAVLPLGARTTGGAHQHGPAYSTAAQSHSVIQPYGAHQYVILQRAQQHRAVGPVTPQQVQGNVPPVLAPGVLPRKIANSNSVPSAETRHGIAPAQPDSRNTPLQPVSTGVPQSTPPGAMPSTTAPTFNARTWTNFHFDREAIMNSYHGIEVRQ